MSHIFTVVIIIPQPKGKCEMRAKVSIFDYVNPNRFFRIVFVTNKPKQSINNPSSTFTVETRGGCLVEMTPGPISFRVRYLHFVFLE